MNIHPRNISTNRYPLFKEIFGEVKGQTVFDFGGGSGNLLYFSEGNIQESKYTCTDVSRDSVNQGKLEFSKSSFIQFNRFNWMYNHKGNTKLEFPEVNKNQDYIWAYSVFSHTDLDEFVKTVLWFTSFNFKKIAVSFLTFNEMLIWAYNKRTNEYGNCVDIKKYINSKRNILYFFDNDKIIFDDFKLPFTRHKYLLTFYNENFLKEIFWQHGIEINILHPGDGFIPFLVINNV